MSKIALILPPKYCLICNKLFYKESCKRISDFRVKKFCSHKCYCKYYKGEKHWNWNGGIKHRPDGYLRDSESDKYIHRIIMEKYLGRPLLKNEQIHHIDGNPSNNDIKNLKLYESNSEHRKYEASIASKDKRGRFISKTPLCA